jgi:hypothetical protein
MLKMKIEYADNGANKTWPTHVEPVSFMDWLLERGIEKLPPERFMTYWELVQGEDVVLPVRVREWMASAYAERQTYEVEDRHFFDKMVECALSLAYDEDDDVRTIARKWLDKGVFVFTENETI